MWCDRLVENSIDWKLEQMHGREPGNEDRSLTSDFFEKEFLDYKTCVINRISKYYIYQWFIDVYCSYKIKPTST